jgi:endonuclease/exonuclease/phosphatase family metal-dependent hydrolase
MFYSTLPFILIYVLMIFNFKPDLNIVSYNIRYNNLNDGINQWDFRKESIVNYLKKNNPDVIGMQEVLNGQLVYLTEELSDYLFIGVGREDGKKKGEYSPILFNQTTLELKESNTFWLSETPDEISVGWDAALERICTYARFKHIKTGKQFWIFNTHFDHIGKNARAQSVQLILKKLIDLNKIDLPTVVMGDFNLTPDTKPIQKLQNILVDVQGKLPVSALDYGTFTGFDTNQKSKNRIDYIFQKDFKNYTGNHLWIKTNKGLWASDHHPVQALFAF